MGKRYFKCEARLIDSMALNQTLLRGMLLISI